MILFLSHIFFNKPILVISIPYGRWGNRLMLFSYVIAWAKKYDCIVMNPSFSEYSSNFTYFKNNPLGLIPFKYNLFSFILKFINRFYQNSLERISLRSKNLPFLHKVDLENDYINTKEINFPKLLSSNRIILFYGFLLGERDFKFVDNQRAYLSQFFSFSQQIQKKCSEVFRKINQKKVIGICMRQGDYKDHFDGKFYLTDVEYMHLISNLQIQYPDYGFFIACEESKSDFHISNGHISFQNPALNLCVLSHCDLLIGPPSTFMTWAAFYKDTAVCYIDKFSWDQQHYTFRPVTF